MSRSMSESHIWESRRIHLLIDPDKWETDELSALLTYIPKAVGSLIVGGTYVHTERFASTMEYCLRTRLPVGNILAAGPLDSMLSPQASYALIPILFGSNHTRFVFDHLLQATPVINRYGLHPVCVAYILLDGGTKTSTEYFTQTIPVPRGKPGILRTLSLMASYVGLSGIYLEAGSGAVNPVSPEEVNAAVKASGLPVLVGGGVHSASACQELFDAGARGIVIGTAAEQKRHLSWLEGI